jgi:hypothetical protein
LDVERLMVDEEQVFLGGEGRNHGAVELCERKGMNRNHEKHKK